MTTLTKHLRHALAALLLASLPAARADNSAPPTRRAAPATAVSVRETNQAVFITTGTDTIELQPWRPGTVRVLAAPGRSIPDKKSLAVIGAPSPGPWTLRDAPRYVRLTMPRLSVTFDKAAGTLRFRDPTGKMLLQEAPGGRRFSPALKPERDGLQISETFGRDAGERFFGLGVVNDQLEQPVSDVALSNGNTQVRVPVLYSSRGYGVFWDNSSQGDFRLTPATTAWSASAGDAADYYVMAGPSADQVIAEYRQLTGNAPLLPKWAYGFLFCKNRFRSQAEILQAAHDFRAHHIPLDLIVQDYYYWAPTKPVSSADNWGTHRFDPERYPDPKAMIAQLHNQDHLHFMVVTWAKFEESTDHAKELLAAHALFPPGHDWAGPTLRYYDPFVAQGRAIYGRQIMESLLPLGVDAFWIDGAEPEMDRRTFAAFDSDAGPVSRLMDAFPLMHTTGLYQAQRAMAPNKRVFLLPRSAWAGMQRNGAVNWTGDINGDWKTLQWQIRGLQNYSIAGLPYITTDIGGYSHTPEADAEHFLRWYQWGAFCPIFRVHGLDRAFPWEYGPEAEAIIRQADELRYRLLPYIYSQAGAVTRQSGTLMRPLVMDFRQDPQAVAAWDEFLFGPQILVCPVSESRYETVPTPGEQWVDRDGKPGGLSVTYISSRGQPTVRQELRGQSLDFANPLPAESKGANLARYEGAWTPSVSGPFLFRVIVGSPGTRLTLNGTTTTQTNPFQYLTVPVTAQAGVPIPFTLESSDFHPAFRVLNDGFPGQPQTRRVYLPPAARWYDFWTGHAQAGGRTIAATAPLDHIPLYVRAGSVLPLGPKMEWASEKPADPVELRVYRGADGAFTLYEDEGDTYHYEHGQWATIPLTWNQREQTLTIGRRRGAFPGMLKARTFRVVWVTTGHGDGIEPTNQADATIHYTGAAVTVRAEKGTARP